VKTVADCFKFRNKIGLDVALEARLVIFGCRIAVAPTSSARGLLHDLAEGAEGHLESLSLKDRLESIGLVDSDQSLTNA
jgi:hypothetical protein